MSTSRFALTVAVLAMPALLAAGGPAVAEEELGSIKGVVTLNGQPLGFGKVVFHLKGGQFVGSKINEDGTFRVDRIPPGTHTVTVEAVKDGRALLPPRYSDEGASALRVEVKAGSATMNFDLKSK